jgi:hypothetical protein
MLTKSPRMKMNRQQREHHLQERHDLQRHGGGCDLTEAEEAEVQHAVEKELEDQRRAVEHVEVQREAQRHLADVVRHEAQKAVIRHVRAGGANDVPSVLHEEIHELRRCPRRGDPREHARDDTSPGAR